MSAITTWDDVKPGDVLTIVKFTHHGRRPFKMRVRRIDTLPGVTPKPNGLRFVVGERLTATGAPSKLRTQYGHRPGERTEMVSLMEITAHEEGTHDAAHLL